MTRILVVSGIGDIHWAALKLRSFCKMNDITDPEVWVWNHDCRPRSLDFVKRLPMCAAGDYWQEPLTNRWGNQFNQLYLYGTRDILSPFADFDHLICVNGSLRYGKNLTTEILPQYSCDWDYELKQTPEEIAFEGYAKNCGPYILLYFSAHGMFSQWLKAWPTASIAAFIHKLERQFPEHRLLLTGSQWDKSLAVDLMLTMGRSVENWVGKTSFDQLMALIRNASGFVGWCGGNTIISTHLNVPTCILWSDYFDSRFYTNWVKPGAANYLPLSVNKVDPEIAALRCAAKIKETYVAATV
jgi:ADP-heptose:LPS heptosyltransferase